MQRRSNRTISCACGIAIVAVALTSTRVAAQWTNLPPVDAPRTADGKVNLSAPAPKLTDGKPDLSGIWEPASNRVGNIAGDLKADDVPYQPWAKALFEARRTGAHAREDPPASCLPQGVPRINAAPAPWKLVQTPTFIVIVYEAFNLWRQIFLDGRQMIADANPTWHGYSTGKWDGDTLVVDTRGFNGKTWLDQMGRPTTEALHVVERFRRKDFGHLDIQVTIDDPKAYTRPWTVVQEMVLRPDTELFEFICNENNRDLPHLPGGQGNN
jgi:hypothetical protein